MSDRSIMECIDEIGMRVEYGDFLNDLNNPVLSFEEWKRRGLMRQPTNPATLITTGIL